MLRFSCFACILLCISSVMAQPYYGNIAGDQSRTLVLLAATSPYDPYYGKYYNEITQFQINWAKQISAAGDNVLVLASRRAARDFRKQLPADQVLIDEQYDIWIRDYGMVRMNKPTMFVYGNQYLSNFEAGSTQRRFKRTIDRKCGRQSYALADPIMDGGNIVDNFMDTAILTRRSLQDNHMSESQLRTKLQQQLGYSTIAMIPDPGDTTGHADGVVSFIDTNRLALSGATRDEPALWDATIRDLQTQLPQLAANAVILDSVWKTQTFDGFDSACGLHINALLTGKNLFVPVFGKDPENQKYGQSTQLDNKVLNEIRGATGRNVVPIDTPNTVCRMGGSVRCLSNAIQGPLADCLVQAAQAEANK